MILTICNLPYSVTYKDIKALIYSKCGIDEMILDNLVPHDNRTKKVTIGLSGHEDAAILTKNIDGIMMNGHQLQVVSKSRIPKVSNAYQASSRAGTSSSSMQTYGSQGSNWSQPANLLPPQPVMAPLVPTMVPPPLNYGPTDMFLPNQSAFYMMNQSTYSTPPSGTNVGYQASYGGNQDYQQRSSWSNESQNAQPQYQREEKWDNRDSRWDNRGSTHESREPTRDNRGSMRDNRGSTRADSNSAWDNSKSNWSNDNSKWDTNKTNWDNNRDSERGNSRESRWNNSGSNWDGNSDRRPNNSRDSNWQSNRDTNRDNTYRSNQSAGSSRDHGLSNRIPPQPSQSVYGEHVTGAGGRFNKRVTIETQQNRYNSAPRQRSADDRNYEQSQPPIKRTKKDNTPIAIGYLNKDNQPMTVRQLHLGRMWRGKFIAAKANNILEDPRFVYETANPRKLFLKLRSIIKERVKIHCQNDYSLAPFRIERKYNKLYGFQGDWVALRDSLQKVGGRLLSKVDAGADNEPCMGKKKNARVLRSSKTQSDAANKQQTGASQGGSQQQVGPKQQTGPPRASPQQKAGPPRAAPQQQAGLPRVAPQQKAGPSRVGPQQKAGPSRVGPQQKAGPSRVGPQQKAGPSRKEPTSSLAFWAGNKKIQPLKKGGKKNQNGRPLALTPGRIPQYPKGDKQQFKKIKREFKSMMASDLSSPIFNGMKPALKKAIEVEVNTLCNLIKKVCDCPGNDPNVADFEDILTSEVPGEMKRVMQINLAKRMLPILPAIVRVFASPPIKRLPLEQFLKSLFKKEVLSLKKAKQHPYYIADLATYEAHDWLCQMKPSLVEGSSVTFKPLHMVDARKLRKPNPNRQRRNATSQQMEEIKNEDQKDGVDDDDDYEVEEYHNDDNIEATEATEVSEATEATETIEATKATEATEATGPKDTHEDICQEMKKIYDQINDPDFNAENEDYQTYDVKQTKEEAYEAFKSVQFTDDNQDFTDDVKVDNIMNNFNEPENDKCDYQVKNENNPGETGKEKQGEDNIDMVEVNDDDLEDW